MIGVRAGDNAVAFGQKVKVGDYGSARILMQNVRPPRVKPFSSFLSLFGP